MRDEVRHQALSAKGFLSEAEGMRLFELAAEASQHAPCLEVGSYCGKSTLFLAEGCRVSGRYPLFAVDHHRGSEEQQPGQSYFDPDLFDADEGVLDTLGPFMRNIRRAGLTQWVVPVVADSRRLSRYWPQAKLSLVFIDGGHSEDDAFADYHGWSPHVIAGGYLCIHDVFADATQGGRAPYHVLQDARASGLWEDVGQVETLAVLKRRDAPDAETPHHTSRAAAIPLRSARHLGTFPRVRTDAWVMIGQDGGQSIELGDDTLFVFSDTLIAPLRNSHLGRYATRAVPTQPNRQGIFLANSAGVASPTNLRHALAELRYYTDDNGLPREIVRPTKAEREAGIRFWPEHGVLVDGRVYLYYLGVQTVDPRSKWGFRNLGAGLAILDRETGESIRVRREGEWCLWNAGSEDLHFGVQVLRERDDIYVFASVRRDVVCDAYLARVKASEITDPTAYEYLESPRPTWSRDREAAVSLGPSSGDYSVSFNPYLGKYLMVYVDGFDKTLKLRTADRLHGSYSAPVTIVAVPHEPASELIYLGFEHPRFRERDGETIYVSYCQPHFTANSLIALRFR